MSVAELLRELAARGVELWFEGERLRFRAPKGALDPQLRTELGARRPEVVAHLRAEAAARVQTFPLSYSQRSLWFVNQEDPASAAYNVGFAARVVSTLDVAAFRLALQALIDRHATLRTVYPLIDGLPVQRVVGSAAAVLGLHDADGISEAQLHRRVEESYRRPFDLASGPVFRADLYSRSAADHVLLLNVHHIAADGWSLLQLIEELRALYAEATGGASISAARPETGYREFTRWQAEMLAGPEGQRLLEYWRRQLAAPRAQVELPADRRRPARRSSRGATYALELDAELSQALRQLARDEGTTLFVVLLAAFKTLLYRHTGTEDVIVGTPTFGRNRPEFARVVGDFVNTVALRTRLSAGMSFRDLLAQLRQTVLDALDAQDCPYPLVVEQLQPARDPGRAPFFEVLFVLQRFDQLRELEPVLVPRGSAGAIDFGGLRLQHYALDQQEGQFDLTFQAVDCSGALALQLKYNIDLYDASTIARLAGHLRELLRGIVAGPAWSLERLPLLADDERGRLLFEWNDTGTAYPKSATVHSLFEAQAGRTPDAVAVRFEDVQWSYGELNARANRLARHLRSLGVGRESLVGVWMERSAEMVMAMLGILKAGGAYVPLDPAFPKDRIDYMIDDAALSVIVTQQALAVSLAPRLQAVCVDRDAAALSRWPETDLEPASGPEDLAYVIYTSGSTGRPKGVELEHRGVVNFLCSMHREPGITAADRFVSVTTLSFDIAGLEIHGPLTCGGTVVMASRATALDGQRLAALLERSDATLLQATPATWRLLLESGWRGRAGLKMLCGGEALPRDLAARLLAQGGELWNLYGPTETTIWSTLARVTDATRAIPIGRPIANTQVYVLEPSGLPAPIGVGGELCIGGDGLARGYRKRPDLTAEKFVTLELPGVGTRRVYRTGDVVRFLADGQLEFVGRRDNQVKVRGFRIELGEIEAVLATHPGVGQCVVHVREDTPGDQRLVGYVVAIPDVPFDADATRAALRTKLPEYMIPNLFVTLAALPLTPNGKIDRKALPAPQVQAVASGAGEAVMTPVQRRVAVLWQQVLGIERVGLNVNFFDVGGHSLLLVRLQSALQREFGGELALVELFQRTTVAAQAERFAAPQAFDATLKRAQARAARQLNG